jgi:hypothetical protein
MAFKPNYNQQRADRNRAKQAKQEQKLLQQQEATGANPLTTNEDEQMT